ncbi:uncharacterized protein LOC126660701 [Mercurialis annua]|uniref:uncharacterized protein LOC126660701 n=1 Tax=Mercurialis annua TaxID=3986 RepID=UPI00215F7763|nr:uncharacterized protein LOC126660701 [Mercurialis annua]XP_050210287.1 uncharacterized protein LOC126660701 [Mercurialis annua]XP_050210288.1 uncharacterized protein LOC126660701 [Mercurialis annua]XP_050210289.1 uncharacterized protein LOC126660701 [Mercurialis annua]XP_050210290.1 uncharacterized protein LOC126660701 [Mercurialis annua]XP_055960203.1 uncharacterized protein LOC126660701 [Mercurialis annua]XP_055960204.1 uncharacterized protein LOC126660701 [Mercurialis annua]XP_05596020
MLFNYKKGCYGLTGSSQNEAYDLGQLELHIGWDLKDYEKQMKFLDLEGLLCLLEDGFFHGLVSCEALKTSHKAVNIENKETAEYEGIVSGFCKNKEKAETL